MKHMITLNGRTYEIEVEYAEPMRMDEFKSYAPASGTSIPVQVSESAVQNSTIPVDGDAVVAPMPGTVLKVNVNVGDTVAENTVLCILEAMKMENEIKAPRAGTVKQVLISQGAAVDTGAALVVLN